MSLYLVLTYGLQVSLLGNYLNYMCFCCFGFLLLSICYIYLTDATPQKQIASPNVFQNQVYRILLKCEYLCTLKVIFSVSSFRFFAEITYLYFHVCVCETLHKFEKQTYSHLQVENRWVDGRTRHRQFPGPPLFIPQW